MQVNHDINNSLINCPNSDNSIKNRIGGGHRMPHPSVVIAIVYSHRTSGGGCRLTIIVSGRVDLRRRIGPTPQQMPANSSTVWMGIPPINGSVRRLNGWYS